MLKNTQHLRRVIDVDCRLQRGGHIIQNIIEVAILLNLVELGSLVFKLGMLYVQLACADNRSCVENSF